MARPDEKDVGSFGQSHREVWRMYHFFLRLEVQHAAIAKKGKARQ